MVSVWRYASGDIVQSGDHVRYRGEHGRVEFVAAEQSGDAATDWYIEEYGGGVMMNVESLGAVFLPGGEIDGGLELIDRMAANEQ
jgi:hypothetical protein